ILGMFIIAIAPGNAVRAHLLPPRSDIIKVLPRLFKNMGGFLISEGVNHAPALLLAFCIGYLCPLKIIITKRWLWAAVLIPVSLVMMSFTLFVTLYLAGGLEQRHYTFAALILILSLFTLGVICAGS